MSDRLRWAWWWLAVVALIGAARLARYEPHGPAAVSVYDHWRHRVCLPDRCIDLAD